MVLETGHLAQRPPRRSYDFEWRQLCGRLEQQQIDINRITHGNFNGELEGLKPNRTRNNGVAAGR